MRHIRAFMVIVVLILAGAVPARAATTPTELYVVGDSITAGIGIYGDWNRTYAHVLEDRVLGRNHDQAQTVGHSSQCLQMAGCGYGPSLLDTWGPEVVNATPRPTTVVVEIGTNDLGNGATAAQVEAGFDQLIKSAPGIRVIIGTIPPRGVTPTWDPVRQAVNAWIRSNYGANVADFDAALTNGASAMRAEADYDGVHPNVYGQADMAYCVPLAQIV
jgi:lysophospholipase L1-like esterase